jgi:cysteine desulfurase/selenocysteine lyase
MKFDPYPFRKDFPALERRYSGKPPVYLDNACVTLRHRQVIEALSSYYSCFPGCHKRTSHKFGEETTEKFHAARARVAKYIGAQGPEEVIFTRNTTEGINLLANTLPLGPGDAVLTSELEHNSNFLPWQALAARKGTRHVKFKLAGDLTFDPDEFKKCLGPGVKLVSVASRSHVTGCALPLPEIAALARSAGALLLVDGAQDAGLAPGAAGAGADFMAFSAHKMLGPSGFGALYVKKSVMEKLPMFLLGGETVADADDGGFTPAGFPERFEAGLQDYAGALGLAAAADYLEAAGPDNITEHVRGLNTALTEALAGIKGLIILGPAAAAARGGITNFYVRGADSATLAALLDSAENIMVRAGFHCAHPWFNRTGTPPSLRVSLHLYNTSEEIKLFAATLRTLLSNFR